MTPSKQELPTPLLRRWFAHEVMLHPRVAEAIAASGRVPKVLRHRLRLIPEIYERTLTLVEVDDLEVERGACLRGVTSSEPSDELHARVRKLLGRPLEQLPDRMAEGHAALEAGHYLEAMLWFMAHNWADPSGDPSGMAALDQALSEDDFAYGFRLAILTASEGEHLDEVLRVYDMAEERAGDLGHLIGVVRANALTTMASRERAPERRQELTERAQTELLRAIEADPGLAGVYKDLGDLCMERYDMALAWDLWDFGRRLAPGHSLFESVAEYERDLATRCSEFF